MINEEECIVSIVTHKGVILKNCAQFINCKSEINNIETHTVMPMYNLIEYSDDY